MLQEGYHKFILLYSTIRTLNEGKQSTSKENAVTSLTKGNINIATDIASKDRRLTLLALSKT